MGEANVQPAEYNPIIVEEPLKSYSYDFDKTNSFFCGSDGYIYADYKIVGGDRVDESMHEVIRRGDTIYYPRKLIKKEVLEKDREILKNILKSGVYPDGIKTFCFSSPPWEWDHYQLLRNEFKMQEAGISPSLYKTVGKHPGVDYHYYNTDYLLHTGNSKFLSMNAQCVFEDGTRFSADMPRKMRNEQFKKIYEKVMLSRKKNNMCC